MFVSNTFTIIRQWLSKHFRSVFVDRYEKLRSPIYIIARRRAENPDGIMRPSTRDIYLC